MTHPSTNRASSRSLMQRKLFLSTLGPAGRTWRLLSLGAMAVSLALSGAVHASPEVGGKAVQSIPGADAIVGWDRIDNQRVLVSFAERDGYLLTLKHQCHGLAWAENVTVTMSNNTIWAGFDSIKADGNACPINHIRKLSAKDILELKAE